MKNLKVSSLFHWLYGAVMFLPIFLLPVFMIYSHRHTIDSGTLEVSQNEVVDFNQQLDFANDSFTRVGIDFDIGKNYITLDGLSSGSDFISITRDNTHQLIQGHKYFLGFPSGSLNTYGIGVLASGVYETFDSFSTSIFTASQTSDFSFMFVVREANVNFNNVTINFLLTDLTQMFGSGNEPTINDFLDFYPIGNYSFTLSSKQLLKDVSTIIYNDTDIMSQATYQLYNATDKYFNISQFFGLENLWDYMVLNWFGGNVTIYLRIFWQLLTYWLVVSIAWLIFDLFMYVPKLAHRWLDRSAIE